MGRNMHTVMVLGKKFNVLKLNNLGALRLGVSQLSDIIFSD